MYISDHDVETTFTVDDLNDILKMHQNLLASYEFIEQAVDPKPLLALFEQMQQGHKQDLQQLQQLVVDYGGKPAALTDHIAITKKMRLMISTRMSSALDLVNEMRHEEHLLLDEYVKNINTLTKVAQLEGVLKRNYDAAEARIDALTQFIENNSNL